MHYDYLIIGQGICGTWLSFFLLEEQKSVLVIDNNNKWSASKVASGLINPVTGRRVVTTWMADELLPFAFSAYNNIGKKLQQEFIQQKNILAFPLAPDLLQAFEKRKQEGNGYIYPSPLSKENLVTHFNFPFDVVQIAPCYLADVNAFTKTWRQYLESKNALLNEIFNEEELLLNDEIIQYKNITAGKIIYCDGINSSLSKYWNRLPFVPNKGQALIATIASLRTDYIYKFGHLSLIPLQNNLWWIGSSNELNFARIEPTDNFFQSTSAALKRFLKVDFTIEQHIASVRPATVERRPFVGVHPVHNQIAILNGMGSKGCSLAPWFAKEFASHLIKKKPINVLVDVNRFANILKRKM